MEALAQLRSIAAVSPIFHLDDVAHIATMTHGIHDYAPFPDVQDGAAHERDAIDAFHLVDGPRLDTAIGRKRHDSLSPHPVRLRPVCTGLRGAGLPGDSAGIAYPLRSGSLGAHAVEALPGMGTEAFSAATSASTFRRYSSLCVAQR